jgi:hypothetical protein
MQTSKISSGKDENKIKEALEQKSKRIFSNAAMEVGRMERCLA